MERNANLYCQPRTTSTRNAQPEGGSRSPRELKQITVPPRSADKTNKISRNESSTCNSAVNNEKCVNNTFPADHVQMYI